MPYRLNKGVYSVRCRFPGCPFNDQIEIEQNIMGVTESDVEIEARKTARDAALVKHDSIYGRRHGLQNPEVRRVSGSCQAVGSSTSPSAVSSPRGVHVREFRRGEVILKKGDEATSICEVLQGVAWPSHNRLHKYSAGDCFGVAALLPNHSRMADIVAGIDRTMVAFYDLVEMSQSDPKNASRLFTRVMEDTLRVIDQLGKTTSRLRKSVDKKTA
jgi:CRP-like cAMP-binding protein